MLKKEDIKKDTKDRLNFDTISPAWKKVFAISGVVFSIGSGILSAGLSIPANILLGIKITTVASGVLTAGSYLDKSKGKKDESLKNNIISNTVRKVLQILK